MVGQVRRDRRRRRRRASRPSRRATTCAPRCAARASTCAPARRTPRSRPTTPQQDLGFLRIALLVFGGIARVRRRVRHLQHVLDHRRPAARRSSRCCVRSARRAGRCSARSSSRRCSSAPSPHCSVSPAGCSSRRASSWPSRRSASTCRRPTRSSSGAHGRSSSLLVGIGVTVVASLAPALRATRIPPMAAMREGVGLPQRSGRVRAILAIVVALAGLAAILVGLFGGADGGSAAGLLGAGAALMFVGVALFSPQLIRPLARVVGRPFESLGLTGRLARENATRQPGRTAATAAALMIGLALVDLRVDLRRGLPRVDRRDRRPAVRRRPDRAQQGRLVADPAGDP